ncbi:ABC transporter ATP-binding protein [Cobetia sp. MMG027]|uniref:ABC transporter ATP-binding protein n=1 Tax=Cobetia sp. MMG027 TaxID=3021980 RepID=UPI0022FF2596|nr:ABC transporter ATP-binding protein [Cobetia sp. MMG027]MDA5562268.1 ABC transporter ATP-binding protein [Cobetia sp. MMG027]
MAEIHLNELAHSYLATPAADSDYAIRRMNHVWQQGGAYALLGPSGCGKSTLLNIISGLLAPSEGEVRFDDRVVNRLPPEERNIAQVFQFPVVYDTMTVFDNLAFPLRNQRQPEHKVQSRVREIAQVLELEDLLTRRASNLTADEKQKVSMGRGLVRDDVAAILFDEPLTVIDPHLKWKLRRKLKQIHEQFNITMVYVTHDQLEASTFADKIAVMYEGRIVQFGTPRELFEDPAHTFVGYFIGSPGMNLASITLESEGVRLGAGEDAPLLHLPRALLATLEERKGELKLGIRPEFVELEASDSSPAAAVSDIREHWLSGQVTLVQDLGTYKVVDLDIGGGCIFKARIEEDAPIPVGRVRLRLPARWQRFYLDEHLLDLSQAGAPDSGEADSFARGESGEQPGGNA